MSISVIQTKNYSIYTLAKVFILNFRIYSFTFDSFEDFRCNKLMFAFFLTLVLNIYIVSFSSSLNKLTVSSICYATIRIDKAQNLEFGLCCLKLYGRGSATFLLSNHFFFSAKSVSTQTNEIRRSR